MAFRDIIMHAEGGKVGSDRADYAVAFAADKGAHLTAVAFAPSAIIPAYGEPGVIAPMPESYFDDLASDAQKALDGLADKAEHQGVSVETRLLRGVAGDFPNLFCHQARYADLAIVGQPQGDAVWSNKGELISRLLLASGRPLLVLPFTGVEYKPPKTALAAWDGSAEAARSFHDALPLLAGCDKTILYVGEPAEKPEVYGDEPGVDIARHLSRHDLQVEVRQAHSEELTVGELILARSASDSVDLIVMGGFHHSRLRELIIGGVTKTVLEQMSIPVFLSH